MSIQKSPYTWSRVFVSIGVSHGQDVNVKVVNDVLVLFVVFDQLTDDVSGDGIGDPLTSVNT